MAITNYERVRKAMDLLKEGLAPFIDREFMCVYKKMNSKLETGLLRLLPKPAKTD